MRDSKLVDASPVLAFDLEAWSSFVTAPRDKS
ncbi:DUF397 domain-containing protein [Saccharopolyspora karakumensis]|nr:DUF397 domain-containing protein [Saccharopolyspora karakumensis]